MRSFSLQEGFSPYTQALDEKMNASTLYLSINLKIFIVPQTLLL
jgi:hypothetical protein